jgi:hypothetical protein
MRLVMSRKMRYAGQVTRTGGGMRTKISVGKLEGKRSVGRHWLRWEKSIKADIRDVSE